MSTCCWRASFKRRRLPLGDTLNLQLAIMTKEPDANFHPPVATPVRAMLKEDAKVKDDAHLEVPHDAGADIEMKKEEVKEGLKKEAAEEAKVSEVQFQIQDNLRRLSFMQLNVHEIAGGRHPAG